MAKGDKQPLKKEPSVEKVQIEEDNSNTGEVVLNTGFGRFEYQNGTVYEGQWKEIDGKKVKDGEGTIIHAGINSFDTIKEEYRGSWKDDQMEGYGVYKYISGAVYRGEWKANQHHGRGSYEFPDGCLYEGEWKEQKMHGEGTYRDRNGRKWQGEFVEGVYQSKMQKKLKYEKILKQKQAEISQSASSFITSIQSIFDTADKKVLKDLLSPFFPSKANMEDIRPYIKEPYPKFEEKKPEQWLDFFLFVAAPTSVNILASKSSSKLLEPSQLKTKQFMGLGQVVEYERIEKDRQAQYAICKISEDRWMLVYHMDVQDNKK